MKTVSIKDISRDGVSKAVRDAQTEPILVSRDNEPAVWMVSARDVARIGDYLGSDADPAQRVAALVAAHLFDQGVLSMGQAARFAGLALGDFIALCDRFGIAVLRESDRSLREEVDSFEAWLRSLSPSTE